MISVPLHWWYIPLCLAILGLVFCARGLRSDEFFAGLFPFTFGCLLIIGALAALLVGVLA